jgi:hypothetical protein
MAGCFADKGSCLINIIIAASLTPALWLLLLLLAGSEGWVFLQGRSEAVLFLIEN